MNTTASIECDEVLSQTPCWCLGESIPPGFRRMLASKDRERELNIPTQDSSKKRRVPLPCFPVFLDDNENVEKLRASPKTRAALQPRVGNLKALFTPIFSDLDLNAVCGADGSEEVTNFYEAKADATNLPPVKYMTVSPTNVTDDSLPFLPTDITTDASRPRPRLLPRRHPGELRDRFILENYTYSMQKAF